MYVLCGMHSVRMHSVHTHKLTNIKIDKGSPKRKRVYFGLQFQRNTAHHCRTAMTAGKGGMEEEAGSKHDVGPG